MLRRPYAPVVAKNSIRQTELTGSPKRCPAFFRLSESRRTGFESDISDARVECTEDRREGCHLTREVGPFETAEEKEPALRLRVVRNDGAIRRPAQARSRTEFWRLNGALFRSVLGQ